MVAFRPERPNAMGFTPQISAALLAASSVFAISMAMVMRPTPPGAGVIAPATSAASGSVVKTKSSLIGHDPFC